MGIFLRTGSKRCIEKVPNMRSRIVDLNHCSVENRSIWVEVWVISHCQLGNIYIFYFWERYVFMILSHGWVLGGIGYWDWDTWISEAGSMDGVWISRFKWNDWNGTIRGLFWVSDRDSYPVCCQSGVVAVAYFIFIFILPLGSPSPLRSPPYMFDMSNWNGWL